MVSFIFVAFVVVKLKNLKCFRGDGASMKWPILEGFLALTPPNVVQLGWNLDQDYSSWRLRQCFKNFSKIQIFSGNRTFPKFARFFGFCPTLRPFFSMKEAEIEKSKYFQRQNYAIGLSEYRKINALSGPNFSGKIRLLFVPFWPFFGEKRGVVTI